MWLDTSNIPYIYLLRTDSHGWAGSSSRCVWPCSLIAVSLDCSITLVTEYYAWIRVKPLPLLKLLECNQISIASSVMQSVYPVTLASIETSKPILCPASMLWSATTDFSGWPRYVCPICSLNLVSKVLPVCLTNALLHSQGIQYISGTFRPNLSFADLSIWICFLVGMWSWHCV